MGKWRFGQVTDITQPAFNNAITIVLMNPTGSSGSNRLYYEQDITRTFIRYDDG